MELQRGRRIPHSQHGDLASLDLIRARLLDLAGRGGSLWLAVALMAVDGSGEFGRGDRWVEGERGLGLATSSDSTVC